MYGYHGKALVVNLTDRSYPGTLSLKQSCAALSAGLAWGVTCFINTARRKPTPSARIILSFLWAALWWEPA